MNSGVAKWSKWRRLAHSLPPLLLLIAGLSTLAAVGEVSAEEACFPADRLAAQGRVDAALEAYDEVLATADESDSDVDCANDGIAAVQLLRCDQVEVLQAAGYAEQAAELHRSMIVEPADSACEVDFSTTTTATSTTVAPTTSASVPATSESARVETRIEIEVDEPDAWEMECIPPTIRATAEAASADGTAEAASVELVPADPDGSALQCNPTTLIVTAVESEDIEGVAPVTTAPSTTTTTTTVPVTSTTAVHQISGPALGEGRDVVPEGTSLRDRIGRGIRKFPLPWSAEFTPATFWPVAAIVLLIATWWWTTRMRRALDPGVLGEVTFAKGTVTDDNANSVRFSTIESAGAHGVLQDPSGGGNDLTDLFSGVQAASGLDAKLVTAWLSRLTGRFTYTITGTATPHGAFATLHGTSGPIARSYKRLSPIPGDLHEQIGGSIALDLARDSASRTNENGTFPHPDIGPLWVYLRSRS